MERTSERVAIIANPISGRGQGRAATERLASLLGERGHVVDIHFTERGGHARDLADALDPAVTRLAVVGGDGTLNEVITGLKRSDVPIGVLPMGTANLLGQALGLHKDPTATADLIERGRIRAFDVGVTDCGRRFVAVAGIGFDATVARALAARRTGAITRASYIRPTLGALWRYDPPRLTVVADGERIATDAAWVLVCNVPRYAAYFRFTPEADPCDGRMDCCVLLGRTRRAVIGSHGRALRGRRSPPALAAYTTFERLEIDSADGPVPFELDGDYIAETPLAITVRPRAVSILEPAG